MLVFVALSFLSVKKFNFIILEKTGLNPDAYSILVLLSTASIILLTISFYLYCKYKPEKSISNVIRDIITGKISGTYGILGILFVLSMVSWFGDNIFNIETLEDMVFEINTFFNIFSFGLIYLLFYPDKEKTTRIQEPEPKKVFIMALSYWKDFQTKSELFKEEIKTKLNRDKTISNWELPLRAIIHHRDKLEKVVFLVSKESGEENHWQEFKRILKFTADLYGLDIDKSNIDKVEVDFNDHNSIMTALRQKLKEIKREYSDEDISVNISGGTSAVTMCLTIFALEDKRQIEYFTQEQGKFSCLRKFDLSKDDAIAFLESYGL